MARRCRRSGTSTKPCGVMKMLHVNSADGAPASASGLCGSHHGVVGRRVSQTTASSRARTKAVRSDELARHHRVIIAAGHCLAGVPRE